MIRLRRLLTWSALILLPAAPALADGAGTLKFDEASFEVFEEAGVASITIERSQGEDGSVSVQVATGGGTATAGQDYTAVSQTLTWGSGDGSDKTVLIPILNDSEAEGSETVQLTLSQPTGGAVVSADRGTSVLVIRSSDGGTGGGGGDDNGGGDDGSRAGTLKFDEREFLAIEGNGNAVVTVERSRGESGTVSVQYATANGTATAGQDYTAVSGTLTWGPGDGSRRSITIPILDDSASEGSETVRLVLSNPTGGAGLDSERGTAVLRIVENGSFGDGDDDNGNDGSQRPGTFKFDERSFQAIEGTGNATVVVERSKGEKGAVSVQYSTQALSATAGDDFTPVSGTLTWAAGDGRSKSFQIPIRGDNAQEGNETVRAVLSNPTGGALLDTERATSTVTILDDDGSKAACVGDDDSLCLLAGRYKVEIVWRLADGTTGNGHVIPASDNSGFVWFFSQDNVEMLLKVLDGCALSNTRWVFFAATTNVDFTVEVTDTATGITKEYKNPGGNAAAPVQDTFTFPCS